MAIPCLVAGLFLSLALGGAARGHACALDSRPSLSTNGRLVVLNRQVARTQAELATWSFFLATGTYKIGQPVAMTENRKEVARTLMPSALRQPWGWTFGDGAYAQGWTVHHAYHRPGRWKIAVYAYNPESHHWDLFDQATITIRA
jgi:hypothetical protein